MRIDTRLAERLKKISPSATLAITAKAKKLRAEGKDITTFAAGEPDFDTPLFVKEPAIEAINSGFTKYTPTTGTPELKKAISEKFKRDNGLEYNPSQIIVSCGAKHSIFNALFVLVNRHDEVLIPSPYWVSYPEMTYLCEGTPRFIKTHPENNFKMTVKELQRYVSHKSKVLILNSPSNPTGCVYTEEELKEIAELCVKKKIFIISDEIYEKIIYNNLRHHSIAGLSEAVYDLTITVNGLSKSHSMTGWRIGFLGAPQDIADAISKFQDHSTSCASSISQKAATAALNDQSDFSAKMLEEFQRRRDYCIGRLSQMKRLDCIIPDGAFYIFCNISRTGMDALSFADRLLQEALVAVIPGEGFGRGDYMRISFATNLAQLEKGLNRIEEWLNKLP